MLPDRGVFLAPASASGHDQLVSVARRNVVVEHENRSVGRLFDDTGLCDDLAVGGLKKYPFVAAPDMFSILNLSVLAIIIPLFFSYRV